MGTFICFLLGIGGLKDKGQLLLLVEVKDQSFQ